MIGSRGLALVFACSTGCLAPTTAEPSAVLYDACRPAELSAPSDVSDAERASIIDAAALWNDLGVLELGMFDGSVSSSSTARQVIPIQFRKASLFFLGHYDGDSGEIFVNRGITAPRARSITIAHELGHAFGLAHVPVEERRSLMNPSNVEVTATAEDAAALGALFEGCGSAE